MKPKAPTTNIPSAAESAQVKLFILRALTTRGDEPMPDATLHAAIDLAFPHLKLSAADKSAAVQSCQAQGWIACANDDLLGTVWTLTVKGKLRAQQI